MKAGLIVLLASLVTAGLLSATPVKADATITSSTVTNGFPRNIVFNVQASADVDIVDVTLSYRIVGRNTSAIGKPDFVADATSIDTDVTVTTGSSSYIPVGSEFLYHWELALADGTTTVGPEESFLYLPPGDEWQEVENDIVRVYYQGDRLPTAAEYLAAGLETYQQMAVDLFGIDLTLLPVKVVLFAEESDLEAARPGAGGALDAAVVNCGTKVTSDIVFVIHRSCGTDDRTDTFRHEFTHIINEAAGEGPLGVIPSWLDEGTAVHSQSDPGANYLGAVDAAIRSNRLIPFAQMATASADANQVNLFYGQAYSMVEFLLDEAGPGTFAEYFATIKAGTRFDVALEQVYGFDLAGFEEAFKEANGIDSSAGPTAAPTSAGSQTQATPVPTRTPLQTSNSNDGDDDGIPLAVIGIVGVSVFFALVAVFFYLLSVMLANNRKAAAGASAPPRDDEWRPPPPPNP
ncbi:MAG: hypothetical protein KC482_07175 [Dehalococcoidia bacterium]|nr:hypothetical protein [Dehalococcoidia bacterium]MCA9853362.1 hypothetical protein [Dehalococcoidia bacterium]